MTPKEKISVIVPIYNVEPYLIRCLDSLSAQSYEDLEILLVDDCSTDGSDRLAEEYCKAHPERFRLIRRPENGGLSAARNTAMEQASGAWVTFVDSDDWVDPDYVAALYETARNENADIVMCAWYYFYPETGKEEVVSPFLDLTTASSQREKIAYCEPSAAARLFRRSLFTESGLVFPTNVRRAAEQGIIIPLFTRTEKISILDRPLYYYYQRKTSNSMQFHKGVDVSFLPVAVRNVEENSLPGFEQELEYRAIADLLYGMVMIMVRSGRPRREIIGAIKQFTQSHPHWSKNPYLVRMPRGKRIFARCAGRHLVFLLHVLVFLWDAVGSGIKALRAG